MLNIALKEAKNAYLQIILKKEVKIMKKITKAAIAIAAINEVFTLVASKASGCKYVPYHVQLAQNISLSIKHRDPKERYDAIVKKNAVRIKDDEKYNKFMTKYMSFVGKVADVDNIHGFTPRDDNGNYDYASKARMTSDEVMTAYMEDVFHSVTF